MEDIKADATSEASLTGLTPADRRDAMAEYLRTHRTARIEELAGRFAISPMTVHRDLDLLSRTGVVQRVRGGARAMTQPMTERDIQIRRRFRATEKDALAKVAAGLIDEGTIVALDDSTTVGAIVPLLSGRQPSTVITHSLTAMEYVATHYPEMVLVGLGGQYYPETGSFLGRAVADQVRGMTADTVFVSTTSIKNNALFHPDEEAASTKQALLEVGDRKVLVADASKFGVPALYHVVGLDIFDDIVVEDAISPEQREQLDSLAATIHYVASI
ncbi:DeoR/GlpR family DNA-binding transcription regulator [Raineyella fluvialis]|uniref:DeoR family transcriptional regulator n=1 Tax=Raineyella fluvialis TaxID=2662261 RepID=A0A5Q2FAM1_9ACTN|nr:DeoR/GlpR family DNA-binding transcription regulator [Raineyella fluvialis]QGF23849.1 DeoR family transcriptional regulator [Raineyella fluvialis]